MARKLVVEIIGDASSLERTFKKAAGSAKGFEGQFTATSRRVSGGFKSLAAAAGVAFGAGALVGGIKSSIDAASDLNEQISNMNVTFGASAKQVEAWSRDTVKSMGLAQDQALEAANQFGGLLKTVGMTGPEAAKGSERLTQLAADLASFKNTSVQQALDALRSGLAGESEPLRKYNVLLSEARVKAEALAVTGKKNAGALTEQDKVLGRLSIIYKSTTDAQGDFARTGGGLANQLRQMHAGVRQLQIGIGQALLPDVLKIVSAVNTWLSSSRNQKRVTDTVKDAVKTLKDVIAAILPLLRTIGGLFKTFAEHVGGTTNAIKLLVPVIAGLKLAQFQASLAGAATEAGRLNTNLRLLRTIGPITLVVGLEVLMHKEQIDKAVTAWLRGHGLGAFTGDVAAGGRPGWFAKLPKWAQKQIAAQLGLAPSAMGDVSERWGIYGPGGIAEQVADALVPQGITGAATAGALPAGMAALTPTQRNQLALAQAAATKTVTDDLAALYEQRRLVARKIAFITGKLKTATGKTAQNLADTLAGLYAEDSAAYGQITSIRQQAAADTTKAAKQAEDATRKAARTAAGLIKHVTLGLKVPALTLAAVNKAIASRAQKAQYIALGLTATGEERNPSVKALRRRVISLSRRIRGTPADTPLNRVRLAGALDDLNGKHGPPTRETLFKIREILDDISSSIGEAKAGERVVFAPSLGRLTRGVNLNPQQLQRLRFNLNTAGVTGAPFAIGGGGGLTIQNRLRVDLDGRQVALVTRRHAVKAQQRTPTQTRGRQIR